jgi:isopentenyl-diphosphate delta-isomerase
MTGGVGEAGPVNRALAAAAQAHGVALGLGSGRVLLEGAADRSSFQVRDVAPDVLLLANLGAVQLPVHGGAGCARLVELCQADALVLHLNAVQEAVQPGGDTNFGGMLDHIASVCSALDVPVVVKEVGFGMAPEDVAGLVAVGVAGIDVAGAGGTNWATLEGLRDERAGAVAAAFDSWGWPTASAIVNARRVLDEHASPAVLIGSGGLRHGVDALKALCLGADLAGVGRGLLAAAAAGPDQATRAVGVLAEQLRIAAWAAGVATAADLTPSCLERR